MAKFFLADDNLSLLIQPQRYFLIGEKGTGKTAYAAYLSTAQYRNFEGHTTFIQQVDYLTMRALAEEHGLKDQDFVSCWELVLLAIAFQKMTKDKATFSVKLPLVFAAAKDILGKLAIADDAPLGDMLELLRSCKEAIEIVNEHMKDEADGRTYSSRGDFRRDVKSLRQFFFTAITSVEPRSSNLVFVDGIDVRPSNIPFAEYMTIVKSLVNAIWVLNSERLSTLPERHLRIVLLIRPDILEGVTLHNLGNKIRDNSVVLDWKTTYPVYRTSQLFKVADRMLASQQDDLPNFELGATWDHYFPYKLFNRARDKDEPSDEAFIPFLRYSFYRPRDIITLMSIMQKRMIDEGLGGSTQFGKDVIQNHRVRQDYSAYLLSEIKDSLSFYYQIDDYELFLKFFEFLDEFVEERTLEFDYDNFVVAYDKLLKHAASVKLEVPVIFSSADRFLQFLYELNIIAFFSEQRSGLGKRPYQRWCFRERSYANIRPKVSADCRYKMHMGIARALNAARFG